MKSDVTIVCVCHSREKGNAEEKKKKSIWFAQRYLEKMTSILGKLTGLKSVFSVV